MLELLIIYICGVIPSAIISTVIAYKEGVLTLKDLMLFVSISIFSWIGVVFYLCFYISEKKDTVLWKRKKN